MSVVFVPIGRLGNAIFRYLACSLFSIKYNLKYKVKSRYNSVISDQTFLDWIDLDKKNMLLDINKKKNYLFNGYYQCDMIYRKYKKDLLDYISKNQDHYVLTDGVNPGDGNYEKFYLKDIVNTPKNFNKFYDFVLHIRLGDKVSYGITLSIDGIKNLIKNLNIPQNSCIVMNKAKNDFEKNFKNELETFINDKNNIAINIESNDILNDFHIMKNAKTLVCSVSTISWCAALLSDTIVKCYMPNYPKYVNPLPYYDRDLSCKYPINNTELYDYI